MALTSRIRRAANIHDDEVASVSLIACVFGTLEAGRSVGEVGVNTLVLSRLSADALPWLYIPLGITSMLVAIGFGAALGRVRRGRLFTTVLLAAAAILVAASLLVRTSAEIVPIAWLAVMAAGALAATMTWTVATSTLDARQAKRLFPLCTAAAIAGSFLGSIAAGPLAGLLGATTLVAVEGVAFALAAFAVVRLAARGVGSGWRPPSGPRRPIIDEVRTGFDEVRHSPLLRLVAAAYVLFAVLLFSVSLPYLRAATAAFPDETRLAGALGSISAVVTAGSFLVSLVVADRFYRRFGVAAAALALPVIYLLGFGVWLVSFSFVTAAAVIVVLQITQRGLSNAAWSAFYNVVPASRRAQALAFNDGVPGQAGIVLSGVLLIVVTRVLTADQIFWLGLAAAALCTAIVVSVRRRYGDALVRSLRRGVGEQVLEGGPDLAQRIGSPEVRRALIVALGAPEPGTRELAATLLARSSEPEARDALAGALGDPVPTVRAAAAVAILSGPAGRPAGGEGDPASGTSGGSTDAETTLDALLAGDAPARLAGLRALARLGRTLDPARRVQAARDPDPAIRSSAITLLGGAAATDEAGTALLREALDDPASSVRRAAATTLAARPDPDPIVIERLASLDTPDQATCLLALVGHGDAVREPILAWAERQVGRAVALDADRRVIAAAVADDVAGGATASPSADLRFLTDVLAQRVRATQDLALAAMGVLGAPAAGGVIRRSLGSSDPDVRAQAIEALDSMGDRRLGTLITRLVEPAPPATVDGRATTIQRLRHDVDPWIRAAARRSGSDVEAMGEGDGSLADIETMLRLRRVPLFATLAPEDLQRIASVAEERTFAADERLIREGEIGDAMFVILEGGVRVVHTDADGTEHLIRTYAEGDHIGELAVLRERPRVATVIADGGPVRTLMLEGAGLMAILRERPDAAMAMLATLAERISVQA